MIEDILITTLIALLLVVAVTALAVWASNDARRRGKSPLLVCLVAILCFPYGLLAWLVFRPPAIPPLPLSARRATSPID